MEVWNNIYNVFDPVAFSLFGIFVRWYGIMYVAALLLALFIAQLFIKKDAYPIKEELLNSYFIVKWVCNSLSWFFLNEKIVKF